MYFVSLETTLWGLARFSNFLALMLHCAALEPGQEESSRPAHITLRNADSGGLNLTTCRGCEWHTYWKCSGAAGLKLLEAQAAQDLHIGKLWPLTPYFRHAVLLGHMGGVRPRGSQVSRP